MRSLIPTAAAAKTVGISQRTLQRWIGNGKIKAPETTLRDGRAVRLWSSREIESLKAAKQQVYRRGRGRKKKRQP